LVLIDNPLPSLSEGAIALRYIVLSTRNAIGVPSTIASLVGSVVVNAVQTFRSAGLAGTPGPRIVKGLSTVTDSS
jgi:hypothetical protein